MQIRVLFFGVLKDVAGRAERVLDLPAGADMSVLYRQMESDYPALKRHRSSLMFSRNREFVDECAALAEGDEVALLPPVSGGAGELHLTAEDAEDTEAKRLVVRIVRETIDVRVLEAELAQPTDGAVVTFAGIVRNNSRMPQADGTRVERETLYLEYEAYEEMALAKMREICAALVSEHAIGRIGMVHRLGRLEIGEASVVIVVASPHRPEAFAACRAAIDRLKKTVPIWKKEFFRDGAVWVEGEKSCE